MLVVLHDARRASAVDACLVDLREDALLEAIAKGGQLCGTVGLQPFSGDLHGLAEADDSGDVFGTSTTLALVAPP